LSWTAADLLWFGTGFNPAITRDRYYPRTPAIEWLQKDDSLFRIFGGGTMLEPDCAEVFGLSDARGCDYMAVRRYEELITGRAGEYYFYADVKDWPKTFPLLAVKYVLSPTAQTVNPDMFELVYSKEIAIYRYKRRHDRALLVYDYQVLPDRADVLARVSAPGFDPRQVLLLEDQPAPPKHPVADNYAGTNAAGSVRIVSYEPDDISIDASLPRPGYLLLLDTCFPGWSATVNGEPAPIFRADYNFRAVALPAGKSTIGFSYRPESLRIGVMLSAGGMLVLAAGWFLAGRGGFGGTIPGANASDP
jgi:hypothetical protein